ncbi:hypothetical protein IC575_012073 [Cucumis melo]
MRTQNLAISVQTKNAQLEAVDLFMLFHFQDPFLTWDALCNALLDYILYTLSLRTSIVRYALEYGTGKLDT